MTTKSSEAARLLGRKGAKARIAATTPEQRTAWATSGGHAARDKATPEERSARAKAAAKARWAKVKRKASVDSDK